MITCFKTINFTDNIFNNVQLKVYIIFFLRVKGVVSYDLSGRQPRLVIPDRDTRRDKLRESRGIAPTNCRSVPHYIAASSNWCGAIPPTDRDLTSPFG